MVRNGALSHKIDYINFFWKFITGSRITVIFLNEWIFPIGQNGEASRWRVCYRWGLPRLLCIHSQVFPTPTGGREERRKVTDDCLAYWKYLLLHGILEISIQPVFRIILQAAWPLWPFWAAKSVGHLSPWRPKVLLGKGALSASQSRMRWWKIMCEKIGTSCGRGWGMGECLSGSIYILTWWRQGQEMKKH